MYLVATAFKKPNFWTVQDVFRPLPHLYLQTCTCTETISNVSVLV